MNANLYQERLEILMKTNEMIRNMPSKKSKKSESNKKEKQSGQSGEKKERSSVSRKIRNSHDQKNKK